MHGNHRKDPTEERSRADSCLGPSLFQGLSFLNRFQQGYLARLTRIYAGRLPCFGALVWAGGGERLRNGSRPGYCLVTLP